MFFWETLVPLIQVPELPKIRQFLHKMQQQQIPPQQEKASGCIVRSVQERFKINEEGPESTN